MEWVTILKITDQSMNHYDFASDILEDIYGDDADEMRDQDEKKKFLSSLLFIDVQICYLRSSS